MTPTKATTNLSPPIPWQDLTEREQTICGLLRSFEMVGLTNPQLAHRLGVSGRTVEKYFQGVYRKSGAVNRAQIVYLLHSNHPGPAPPLNEGLHPCLQQVSLLLEYYLSDAGLSLIKVVGLPATVVVAELSQYIFNTLRMRAAATLVGNYQNDPAAHRLTFHHHLSRLAKRESNFLRRCHTYLITYQQTVLIINC